MIPGGRVGHNGGMVNFLHVINRDKSLKHNFLKQNLPIKAVTLVSSDNED